jgi:Tfp pilus assembly protein FimV
VSRTKVRPARLAALVAAFSVAVVGAGRAAGSDADSEPLRPSLASHLVRPGDTIWEIARSRVGTSGDPRPLVEAIREVNGLPDATVDVGQLLLIPPAP